MCNRHLICTQKQARAAEGSFLDEFDLIVLQTMSILREDLHIFLSDDDLGGCFVTDPNNDSVYRFDETESIMLDAIKKPYQKAVLVAKINSKHKLDLRISDLDEFLKKVSGLGLLNDSAEVTSERTLKSGLVDKSTASDNGGRSESGERKTEFHHWRLFNPQPFLDVALVVARSLGYFYYLYVVAFLFAVVAFIFKIDVFLADLKRISLDYNLATHLIFTMFTVNLMTQLSRGVTARNYNIPVPSFGIILAFGLIPRFDATLDIDDRVSKEQRLKINSASFKARCILFLIGVLFWVSSRHQGSLFTDFWISLIWVSIISFLFLANPLIGADGYRYLATYFNEPRLRENAFLALRHTFVKPPESVGRYVSNSLALKLFAFLSVLFIVSLVLFFSYLISGWLKFNYSGLGIVVFTSLIVYLFWLMKSKSRKLKMRKAGIDVGVKKEMVTGNYIGSFASVRWFRCLFLGTFFAALLLPYQYETGGTATIFPIKTQGIYVEMPGVVENVRVQSNTWLEKGAVVAELSNHKQLRDREATKQAIVKTTENLNILLTTPSKEQLSLAKEQLNIAQLEYKYSIANKERMENLYKEGTISLVTYLNFEEKSEVDYQEVLERKANLEYIESLVNEHAIESAKAELKMLQQDLIFYEEQLKRTRLTMPSDGRIITMNLDNLENKYLEDGQLFAEIERTDEVKVEINIPESDIGQISIGSYVSLKVLFLPNDIMTGQVTSIYPQTSESEGGNVFKVISIIPNNEGILQTGMTGYAKIKGKEMYLIEAFTRALIRFVLVETWSWLP